MGQQTRFHFETQEGYDDTVRRVLKNSPRPVITVPARLNIKPDDPRHTVLVAYDGSLQAARALQAFQTSGLAGVLPTIVVSVSPEQLEASRVAERAIDYLRFHDIKAQAHPVTTHKATAPVLLKAAAEHKSVLIVMGAYGQPILREFFIGSVTRSLLAATSAVTRQPGWPWSSQTSPRTKCWAPWSLKYLATAAAVSGPGPGAAALPTTSRWSRPSERLTPSMASSSKASGPVSPSATRAEREGAWPIRQAADSSTVPPLISRRRWSLRVVPELVRSTMMSAMPRLGCSSRAPCESTSW